MQLTVSPLLCKADMGVYTELRACLSPELTLEMNGGYVMPLGRIHPSPRKDLVDTLRSMERGERVNAGEFRDCCGKETAALISLGNIGHPSL
jgi:hypothetical protein